MSAPTRNPEEFFWRTDLQLGNSIHALLSNDPKKSSPNDPLLGTMETSTIAEDVVNSHNGLLKLYGRHYPDRIAPDFT